MAGSYRDLIAWKKAMVLVREIYCATEAFPCPVISQKARPDTGDASSTIS